MNNTTRECTLAVIDSVQEQIDEAFYQNLYLLSIKFPMNKELKKIFIKGILRIPNTAAFHQIAFYLMSIIDSTYITPDLTYVFSEPKMAVPFRKQFLAFINDMEKKYIGYISPIVMSRLVSAGGPKIVKLMFELTQVALVVQISKNDKVDKEILKIDQIKSEEIDKAITHHQKQLHEFVEKDCLSLENVDVIEEIFKRTIKKIKTYSNSKMQILNKFIDSVMKKSSEFSFLFKELLDLLDTSTLLKDWEDYIEDQVRVAEETWDSSTSEIKSIIEASKSTSEEVLKIYRKEFENENTLEYDVSHGNIQSDCDSQELQHVLNKVIENNKLNLPRMFEAYNIILRYFVEFIHSCDSDEKLNGIMKECEEKLKDVQIKINETGELVSYMQQRMKVKKNVEKNSFDFDGHEWILDYNC